MNRNGRKRVFRHHGNNVMGKITGKDDVEGERMRGEREQIHTGFMTVRLRNRWTV